MPSEGFERFETFLRSNTDKTLNPVNAPEFLAELTLLVANIEGRLARLERLSDARSDHGERNSD